MRRYDLYSNPFPASRPFAPLVVILSSHLLSIDSAVVAPLLTDPDRAIDEVDVRVAHDGKKYVVGIHDLAAIGRGDLKRPLGTLIEHADALERAIHRLFTGF